MNLPSRSLRAAVAAFLTTLCFPSASCFAVPAVTVAKTGDYFNGMPAGTSIDEILDYAINDDGDIGMVILLSGSGVDSTNDAALLVVPYGDELNSRMVAREGDQVPGLAGGVVFSDFDSYLNIDDRGRVGFRAQFGGAGVTGANDYGVLRETGGGLVVVAREGDPAPGTVYWFHETAFQFDSLRSLPLLGGQNRVLFGALLNTLVAATYHLSSGSTSLLLMGGGSAPGTASSFTSTYPYPFAFSSGSKVLYGKLAGADTFSFNQEGIWRRLAGGDPYLLYRTGGTLPGLKNYIVASSIYNAASSPGGLLLMNLLLARTDFLPLYQTALYLSIHNQAQQRLLRLALRDQRAPGISGGGVFDTFTALMINRLATYFFMTQLFGKNIGPHNDHALYIGNGLRRRPIIQEGAQAPGLEKGVLIDQINGDTFALNDANQLAWTASLKGLDILPGVNDYALFATLYDGRKNKIVQTTPVVRRGDEIDIGGGDVRMVEVVRLPPDLLSSSNNGQPRFLTLNGSLAAIIDFTGNTNGLMVFDIGQNVVRQPDNYWDREAAGPVHDTVGDDVFNRNGQDQTLEMERAPGATIELDFYVENNGSDTDSITVVAKGGKDATATAAYHQDPEGANTDVTTAIKEGGVLLADLEPGRRVRFRITVTVDANAKNKSKVEFKITSTSNSDGTQDVIKLKVIVKTP